MNLIFIHIIFTLISKLDYQNKCLKIPLNSILKKLSNKVLQKWGCHFKIIERDGLRPG